MQNLSRKLLALEGNKADEDLILSCRENLLDAKREMLLWNKLNKKTQIDIYVKQISTLQLQMDSEKSDLHVSTVKRFIDSNLMDEVSALCNIIFLDINHFDKSTFESFFLQNRLKLYMEFEFGEKL